ncbi:nucleoside-diphosphate-sugar epimerase family protein [Xylariales sp. PMI_506]|nr:nucleoside-diphosphate-sugar epimerase family protein [Xylariales sp. PMI_506]
MHQILIVGATGAQGSATIAALADISTTDRPINILALTRSAASEKSQALIKRFPKVSLVVGDISDPTAIFRTHPDITSIFLVTVPPNDEAHGVALINAAIAHNIPHVVFSSVDRGGNEASWKNPTTVSHFAAKHKVELHLRAMAENSQTRWTILRPTGFMDNYRAGSFVSVQDIGNFAAIALMNADAWAGKAVGLAGDELTFAEANEIYKKVSGQEMPRNWPIVSQGIRWVVSEANQSMEWFEKAGFKVDLNLLRRQGIALQDFKAWLRETIQ